MRSVFLGTILGLIVIAWLSVGMGANYALGKCYPTLIQGSTFGPLVRVVGWPMVIGAKMVRPSPACE